MSVAVQIRKFVVNIFLMVCSLAITIIISEMAARVVLKAPSDVRESKSEIVLHQFLPRNLNLLYKPIPGAQNQAYGVDNVINASGFRGRNIEPTKPAGTKRWAFLGDSVVYGYGLSEEETIPYQLEEMLQSTEVMNLGVSGYDTIQAVEFFKDTGLEFEPDVVILGYTLNDSIYASMELDFFHDKKDVHVKAPRDEWRKRFVKFLFDHSVIMNYLEERFQLQMRFSFFRYYRLKSVWHYIEDRNRTYQDAPDSEYRKLEATITADAKRLGTSPAGLRQKLGFLGIGNSEMWSSHWSLSKKAAQELAAICKERGIPVVAVIFPYGVEMESYALGSTHRFLTSEFQEMGFHVIDLMDFVVDQVKENSLGYMYSEPIHFSAQGAKLVAAEIARMISERKI